MRHGVIAEIFRTYVPQDSVEEQWDIPALEGALAAELNIRAEVGRVDQERADPER